MRYNSLGASELQVSEIALGCMSLSSDSIHEAKQVVQSAFDFGINYFDTADLYERGNNEELLGKAVKDFRQDIILASKVGNQWQKDVAGWIWNPSRDHILQSVDASLKRLGTDYIDLYQLHGGTDGDDFDEIVGVFDELVRVGKIRYYGISSIRPNVFKKYLKHSSLISNMMQYSALDTRPEEYFDLFVSGQANIVARGALAQGVLVDKEVTKPYLSHSMSNVQQIKDWLANQSLMLGIAPQAAALKYCLDQAAVSATVIGIRTIEQLLALKTAYKDLESISWGKLPCNFPKIKYQEHRN